MVGKGLDEDEDEDADDRAVKEGGDGSIDGRVQVRDQSAGPGWGVQRKGKNVARRGKHDT